MLLGHVVIVVIVVVARRDVSAARHDLGPVIASPCQTNIPCVTPILGGGRPSTPCSLLITRVVYVAPSNTHLLGRAERDVLVADALHGLEVLGAVGQAALVVDARVDKVGVVEGELDGAVNGVVDGLDTQHERVVLVADLVLPGAEAAAREDVLGLEVGQDLLEGGVALVGGSRVAVVEAAVVGGDDFVLGLEHLGVDETLDGVGDQVVLVAHGLEGRLGNLEHDGPVGTRGGGLRSTLGRALAVGELKGGQLDLLVRLVVGRVVGEDGGTVEGAVVFDKVQPALVADALGTLATDADTNDVGGGVEQRLDHVLQRLVLHGLSQVVERHGVDEFLVLDHGAWQRS